MNEQKDITDPGLISAGGQLQKAVNTYSRDDTAPVPQSISTLLNTVKTASNIRH